MESKRMEFATIIVTFNYKTRALTIEAKPDVMSMVHGEPDQKGSIVLNGVGLGELREALEGIGQQLSSTEKRR